MVIEKLTDSTSIGIIKDRNFFTDYLGVQAARDNLQKPVTPHQYDAEKLYKHFMYNTEEYSIRCLLHLDNLKRIIKIYLTMRMQEGVEVEMIDTVLVTIIKSTLKKGVPMNEILKKLPYQQWKSMKQSLAFVAEYIPKDFFEATSVHNGVQFKELTLNSSHWQVDSLLREPFSKIDDQIAPTKLEFMDDDEVEEYSLSDRYNFYKDKIPEYTLDDFAREVYMGLNSDKSDDELFNEFLDMFGCEIFEFISEIIKNRYSILINWAPIFGEDVTAQKILEKAHKLRFKKKNMPPVPGQILVQSEEEKNLAKQLRKLERKSKAKPVVEERSKLSRDLEEAQYKPIFKKSYGNDMLVEDFPHVHDSSRGKSVASVYNGVRLLLPENVMKKQTEEYIEFKIPGGSKADINDIELVKISSLDPTGQLVFSDIKQLNRIQSEVFPVAYNTNENMLICAPTGAGKTNIALLSIVHQIRVHTVRNIIQKDQFKIVYVCPMKALATEMVANFSKKLSPIGITVKELTGDMQLTRHEIAETQMLVTTPEKWDVITRKGAVDTEITSTVKLLILDEVHLLNGSRGPVIEALVARTLRQVISSQSMIRIVALSATLPGYLDVANFLKVNARTGLFFFDNRFRSVPLTQTFIGMLKKKNENEQMDQVCYDKMIPFIKEGHQVMVFVTSRNLTSLVANNLMRLATLNGHMELFYPDKSVHTINHAFKSDDLHNLVPNGFGVHHAGMCRPDRLEIESLFRRGVLKVIVCTTTLAWGVNLPAHAVIIRGTTRYDAAKSAYVNMDILDVMQIFGRAGRPQYDTSGNSVIITSFNNITEYLSMLTTQTPIESQFLNCIPDNLNAEIVLGTVSNIREAMQWLTNTYLYCRIKKNPLVYGITFTEVWDDTKFHEFLHRNLHDAATTLEKSQLIRFDDNLGELRPTNFGRIASFYYISYKTMELFHEQFDRDMTEADLLSLISRAAEFSQIQVRNDELSELDRLRAECAELPITQDSTSVEAKVMTLIQANISRARIRVSSLISDCEFIMQSVVRFARALFEIAVDKNFACQVSRCLMVAQMLEQKTWHFESPLMQFKDLHFKGMANIDLPNFLIEELREMSEAEIGQMVRNRKMAGKVLQICNAFPLVNIDVTVKPITHGVLRIRLLLTADFKWEGSIHTGVEHFYAWVEDPLHDNIYHFEQFVISKRMCVSKDPVELVFTVPLITPHAPEYYIKVASSKYLHASRLETINLDNLVLLPSYSIQTKILSVRPLPKTALHNKEFEDLYGFTHFNAVQSQVFHCCYNTDNNVLLGAPTGSGKTIVSEICMLKLFSEQPHLKVVYIAPMKALVRERVTDWSVKFKNLGKNVVEVTGDVTPRSEIIAAANIIITTPEKWDGMSRNWLQKNFVKEVGLVIIDEIHLLGEERGPVLEVIVSRMNYINSLNNTKIRIVGLSTAMANAGDLANWLGIEKKGLYNFSSSVRPVPLEIHLKGFTAKNYCPRMASMNKPAYQAICQYAPNSPSLIFVSSRKQTRLTALDLIKCLMNDINPKQWLHCSPDEIEGIQAEVHDKDLQYLLMFGIGIHHAGLQEGDRKIVESLYVNQKIQVLVATATLAWGVNFPAHLVIIKGTEYYDGATKRYIDMPVTDVLQMMGRAGRPQYDTSGVACVFVQESKKNFYRKFLFEPFPVESNLTQVLPEHVNAEIANGTITCKAQLLNFICSTFFFRRLLVNPGYYKLEETSNVNEFLNELAESVIDALETKECVISKTEDMQQLYESTFLGELAAQYYLFCKTILYLHQHVDKDSSFEDLLLNICHVEEYALFPVRHNEDNINRDMVLELDLKTKMSYDSPHLKVLVMLMYYLLDKKLPNQEYVVDLKTVFDQIMRILQAMISLTSQKGWYDCTMKLIYISQMIIQGTMITDNSVYMLPHITENIFRNLQYKLYKVGLIHDSSANLTIPLLRSFKRNDKSKFTMILKEMFEEKVYNDVTRVLYNLPIIGTNLNIRDSNNSEKLQYKIDPSSKAICLEVKAKTPCIFEFELKREGSENLHVYSKKFGKQKEESWCLIMSDLDSLICLQKFTMKRRKTLCIPYEMPLERGVYEFTFDIMSDSYVGLDQQICVNVQVVA